MSLSSKNISKLVVGMILVATMFPLALGLLVNAGNYEMSAFNATGINESAVLLSDLADPSIITLLTVVVPIIAVIAIVTSFLAYQKFTKK